MALASKKRNAAKKTTTRKTPAKEALAKEAPAKEAPAKEVPTKEVPTKEVPTKEVPTKEAEVEAASVETEQATTTQDMNMVVKTTAPPPATPGKLVLALDDCKNVTEPYVFGALPRITAEQGTLLCDKEDLGSQIEITIISYNDAYTVSPNDQDAGGELCRYSYDGVTLNDGSGMTVNDWIAELRADGYERAGITHRYEIIAVLNDAVEDHDEIGNVVQLSLSSQSAKQFDRFKLNSAMKIRQGEVTEDQVKQVTVTAKTKTFSFTFTIMRFSITEN